MECISTQICKKYVGKGRLGKREGVLSCNWFQYYLSDIYEGASDSVVIYRYDE